MNKNLILMGPPGGGKGTISELLIERFNIVHISVGDILREHERNGDELGKKISAIMDKGDLLPDTVVNEIVKLRLSKDDVKNGFILDGYPRQIEQAKFLLSIINIDEIVVVDISDEEIIERLQWRRTCPKCGASFHIKNIPPKVEGICDFCGTKLEKRADEDQIKHRLEVYHKETEPIIKYYEENKIKIKKVPGNFDVKHEKDMMANLIMNN